MLGLPGTRGIGFESFREGARLFSFFHIDRIEGLTLLALVSYSAFSFLPAWRTTEVAGMAVFGWLMAGLMVLSPTLVLVVLARGRGRDRR
jgi:hypothetical protein